MARPVPVTPDRGGLTGTARARQRPAWRGTAAWDIIAGLSVALVLVPQSLAYAQLAGLPPEQGLYAAALAPIAGALLGSSPYLQTGPTAGTALLVLGTLSGLAPIGGAEYVALAALLAVLVGAWRVLLGLLKGGPLAYLMSQPVMIGFTAAAGLLIVSSQLPAVLGMSPGTGSPLTAAWQALVQPGAWQLGAIAFALLAAVVMVVARRISPLVPGVLLAVAGTITVSALAGYPGPIVGRLPAGLPALTLDLPWSQAPTLLLGSLVIALVGFAEPSAIARRYAAADHQRWQPNREMVSQGLANLAAGFGGGFPVGGSFSRTALNRLAGGRTRLSGLVTGLAALAFLPMTGVLAELPTAVLGAIVIVAVAPLLTVGPVRRFWAFSRPQGLVAAATFVITLALAPRIDRAVLIGIGLAVTVHLWRELHVQVPSWTEHQALHLRPRGVLFFASAPPIEKTFGDLLAAHPDTERLVLHCDGLGRIDLTGALALRTVLEEAQLAGVTVDLVDVPPHARRILSRVLPGGLSGAVPRPTPTGGPG
jgi:SulP family sulfate permease